MGLSAWLLAPDVVDGPLLSGWAGKVWEPNIFLGQIRAVRLEGRPMPGDGTAAPDAAELRRRLDQGSFTLEAEVKSGGEVYWSSWIYKLKAGKREELTLYQLRRSAGVAVPVRGVEFRLQPVTATLPDGLPSAAGDSVRLQASLRGGTILLRSTYSGRTHSIAFGLSPAYGWRLVSPFELGRGDGVRWFTALCLVLSIESSGVLGGARGPGCGLGARRGHRRRTRRPRPPGRAPAGALVRMGGCGRRRPGRVGPPARRGLS